MDPPQEEPCIPRQVGTLRAQMLMKDGGIRMDSPLVKPGDINDGRFTSPEPLSAFKAVTLRDAENPDRVDPKSVINKLHINWGHASATQIKRVLADAEGNTQELLQVC